MNDEHNSVHLHLAIVILKLFQCHMFYGPTLGISVMGLVCLVCSFMYTLCTIKNISQVEIFLQRQFG